MNLKSIGCALLVASLSVGAFAAAQNPDIAVVSDKTYGGSLESISDNGEWAVGYGASLTADGAYSFPRLYNVKTKQVKNLYTEQQGSSVSQMMGCDVTNDGSLIVGQFEGMPAIWRTSTGAWEKLPVPSGYTGGNCTKVTPDGKYAVGTVLAQSGTIATLVYWDLTGASPKIATPANLPKPISRYGELQEYQQIYAVDLSPDGRRFTGIVCFSYPEECWSFIYDLDTDSWKGVDYAVLEVNGKYIFKKVGEGYNSIEEPRFWPGHNDKLICGALNENDVECVYIYDIAAGTLTKVPDSDGLKVGAADSTGAIYASSSIGGPMRDWHVRVGDYWYAWEILIKQLWNLDWQDDVVHDEEGLTGTLVGCSDDGLVLLSNEYSNTPYDSFLIQLPSALSDLAPTVNLLGNYYVTPVNNSAFAVLNVVKVTFDREIEITGQYSDVKLTDADGNSVANSISLAVDPNDSKVAVATFRNRRLEAGKKYAVTFPAGVIGVKGDTQRTNDAIVVNYVGRPSAPVAPVSISPESGSTISKINASSNPVAITFDAEIAPVSDEAADMCLYRIDDEGDRELISRLSGSISGKVFSIYPIMEQRLARGSKYEIVIAANTVSDISGADPNEEISIQYIGSYLPQASDGSVIFEDDFNSGIDLTKWMYYDVDENEPTETMQSWGFVKGLPWWIVRDDVESTDMAAVSHSMYSPAGQSDDWLVTNRLYINDDTAVLSFKSQSYKASANDVLKVVVYETDDIYTALTPSILDKFRYYGDVVYEQKQTPGASEELMAGDWLENVVKLDKYAGKNIYVAFWNNDRNQSAIFLDDVKVSRDVRFSVVNLTPESQLAKENAEVKGIITVESLSETFQGYTINLLDAAGNKLSTLSDPSVEASKGWTLEFTMPDKLVTPVGKEVKYALDITMGDYNEKIESSVKNLAIKTTKKVVLEEFTGQNCPNCPMGHAATAWLEQDFPGQVLPHEIHTYEGDSFGTPQASKLQSFLGFTNAPTGRVNRGPIAAPMDITSGGQYLYKNAGVWYDYVVSELSTLAPADIEITYADYNGDSFDVELDVKYALDMENQNVNILTVVCEDNLMGVQENNRYTSDSEALREWGSGGKYGQENVAYEYHNVVRTWAGTTANGTGGYIPAAVEGGKIYSASVNVPGIKRINKPQNCTVTTMLIDAESGKVINADRRHVTASAVTDVTDDAKGVEVFVSAGTLNVASAGAAEVAVFAIDGSCIARAEGSGLITLDVNAYRGVAVVTVKTASATITRKVML